MSANTVLRSTAPQLDPHRARDTSVVGVRSSAYVVSSLLAAVAAAAAAPTWFAGGILHGTEAMNGSARGTALVVLVAVVPILVGAMWFASRGSTRAVFVWLGAVAHLLYQAFLFTLATPFNALFLLYEAMLALSIWSAVLVISGLDVHRLPALFDDRLPHRGVARAIWVIVGLNALAWLGTVIPALGENPPTFLDGTGLTTNPIYVQDLALWLPLAAVSAWWLYRRDGRGLLFATTMLTYWVLEAPTIAVDQWVGATADPSSSVVSKSMVVPFLVLALVTAIPAWLLYRSLPTRDRRR